MEGVLSTATLWIGLTVLATIVASHLHISMALIEIVIGILAAFVFSHLFGDGAMGANEPSLKFVAPSNAAFSNNQGEGAI